MTGADLDNPRYKRKGMLNPYGELCTRAKWLTGETIHGELCCHGLENLMTDDVEDECKRCPCYLVWNQ